MTRLRHPYIAEFIGYILSDEGNRVMFLTKYYSDGDLFDHIHQTCDISDTEMTKIAFKIAQAMAYVHSKGILHHDLKTDNIMLDKNDPKIIDFGYADFDNIGLNNDFKLGTVNYMAPEVLRKNDTYNSKSDVYSFAHILWEMYCKKEPFKGMNFDEIRDFVLRKERLPFDMQINQPLRNLITDCWKDDQKERPSFKEIIARMINEKIMFQDADKIELEKFYRDESMKINNAILKIEDLFSE